MQFAFNPLMTARAAEHLSSAMGGRARALVRQLKAAVFFCENRRNQAAQKVLRLMKVCSLQ